ncbi:SCO2523 family variant P-loop protein [Actinomadura parmotrematis]|uniref:ParA family protein n=1 Tax=Actinomadura parmotrematis TaxID=2864039 RepID=A0ABS7G571_9ACTN|nr:SCO2523 family variant P-loop protein [Actinomadura parmotrematis]MBW8487681.1 ParA family protein [Actinomadura parmotrematis]
MLVIATSDKGGTGRSVTACNVAYRRALRGHDTCYLDFDFGSPTSGAIFGIAGIDHGVASGGLHRYLQGDVAEPERVDVWAASSRRSLRARPAATGRLVLFPGDLGGGEFTMDTDVLHRCVKLLVRLDEEFDHVIVDLSAGRSHAAEMLLTATADPELARRMEARWLVFHRWTRQHITAAAGLVHGKSGLVQFAAEHGHRKGSLLEAIRFVRTAVISPDDAAARGLQATQQTWLRRVNSDLNDRAIQLGLGRSFVISSIPLDPVLQWREQILTDADVYDNLANAGTVEAFSRLAEDIESGETWSRP